MILIDKFLSLSFLYLSIIVGKTLHDFPQDGKRFCGMSSYLPYTHGIGCITDKAFLIQIDTHSNNTFIQLFAHKVILDEDTGQFLLVPVNVIRPFDTWMRRTNIIIQNLLNAQSNSLKFSG